MAGRVNHRPALLRTETAHEAEWVRLRRDLALALENTASESRITPTSGGELATRTAQALCLLPQPYAAPPPALEPPFDLLISLTGQLRNRLSAYLYATAALQREYRWPSVRPVVSEPATADALLLGDALLVAPVVRRGMLERTVALPAGDWFEFWSDQPHAGGQLTSVCAPLERLPVFVRAGAIIPLVVSEDAATSRLCLRVYPGDNESTLYEDGGHPEDYANGNFRWTYVTTRRQPQSLTISRRVAGRYAPAAHSLMLEMVGLPSSPLDVVVDRRSAPLWFYNDGRLELNVVDDFSEVEVSFDA